jgi:hypothetical protein
VRGDVPVNGETILVTDFVNLKIKTAQSFRYTHKNRMYVCVHKGECSYMYEYLRSRTEPESNLRGGKQILKQDFFVTRGQTV